MCSVTTDNYVWWEQDGKKCSFTTGVTFTTHLDSDAASRPLYSWAGYVVCLFSRVCSRLTLFRSWGSNGYKNWNCYKDNGRQLYRTSGPEWSNTCYSVYYCIPQ